MNPQATFLDRILSVPRPQAGELAITEELGPKGKRNVAASTVVSLVLVVYGVWWMYKRLGAPTRLYPKGQFEPTLWSPFKQVDTWRALWRGLQNTLTAATAGIVCSLIIGVLMAALRHGSPKGSFIRGLSTGYVEFFRACALVLLIASPFRFFNVSPWKSVVIGLTLYYSTTIAEVTRSALRSLPKGQTEAGLAVGLTPRQTMTLVLLPQGLRRALPNLLTQTASLLKDTSLGFIVTFADLLSISTRLGKEYDNYLPSLIVCAAIYIVIIGTINFIATRVQRNKR
jgi:glutamate transport system permease protein